ncbi:MAG TPA: hypothetical protein VJ833_00115 [Rhodanobacteraceae bacterium]|nr:hypothetical protein [Rhodanobacteraceae bacterium]
MHERADRGARRTDVTKLDKPLRREVEIDSKTCTFMVSPYKLKLTPSVIATASEAPWPALSVCCVGDGLGPNPRSGT